MFEKKILNILHIFLSSEISFFALLRIIFSSFDVYFCKERNKSSAEGSIIRDFLY